MSRRLAPAALLLPLVLLAGDAVATTVRPLSRAELAAGADTIVRGRVLQTGPVRSEKSGRILTRSRFRVDAAFKGAPGRELELEQMGGTLDGRTLVVPGDARLEKGEEAVLFLRCEGKPRCHLYGLALGKFGVKRGAGGAVAVRELNGLRTPGGEPVAEAPLTLQALEAELRGLPR